ncbi:MAG: hypothetical protein ACFB0B_17100 [Thermonemataceae bacterium]
MIGIILLMTPLHMNGRKSSMIVEDRGYRYRVDEKISYIPLVVVEAIFSTNQEVDNEEKRVRN